MPHRWPTLAGEPRGGWLDAAIFAQTAGKVLAGRDIAGCPEALALYGGEYLPEDRYEDWAARRREELRGLHLMLLLHLAPYAASKGAMVALSRKPGTGTGADGITVNVVAPGWIATPRSDSAPREDLERLIATTPLGYQGRPEHVAGAVLFYASPLADFVSGTYLPVSGGHDL